jgi:hypothetical protein
LISTELLLASIESRFALVASNSYDANPASILVSPAPWPIGVALSLVNDLN